MTDGLDLLEQATSLLFSVARIDTVSLTDDQVIALLSAAETAGRLTDAIRVRVAGEVDARSRFELGAAGLSVPHGHRKPVHLIEHITRVSQAEAARRIRLGSAIRPRVGLGGDRFPATRPAVADGLVSGTIGVDAAVVIVRCLKQAAHGSEALPWNVEAAERSLVEAAATDSVDLVATSARVWREALDPDGAVPRYEDILKRRGVAIGRERNGITDIHMTADPLSAALIKTALADSTIPGAAPRFLSAEDTAAGTRMVETPDGPTTVIADSRSREQKLFDTLLGVIHAGVQATHQGPTNLRTTGTVTAVITLKDLALGSGIGWIEDIHEPVPAQIIQEMVCDTDLRLMVTGERGQPLYEGRRERLFTPSQRRALAVRDGGCIAHGCTAPPTWCHAHHVVPWQEGGPTDVDNGVPMISMPTGNGAQHWVAARQHRLRTTAA